MKTQTIFVENIKCAGCMTSIKNALLKIKGIKIGGFLGGNLRGFNPEASSVLGEFHAKPIIQF